MSDYLKKKISEGKLMVQNRDPSNMNNSTPLDIVNLPNMVTHMYNMPINKDDLRQISLVITKHDGSTYY